MSPIPVSDVMTIPRHPFARAARVVCYRTTERRNRRPRSSSADAGRAVRGLDAQERRLDQALDAEPLDYRRLEQADVVALHERDRGAAEPAAGHPRAERAGVDGGADGDVELVGGHLEVRSERRVRIEHQL